MIGLSQRERAESEVFGSMNTQYILFLKKNALSILLGHLERSPEDPLGHEAL